MPDPTNLLLHCDGTNGSTSFPDAAGRHVVTANDGAQVDTSQSFFGGGSALFTAQNIGINSSSLTLDGSTEFVFGTADFTIDFRIRFRTLPGAFGAGNETIYYAGPNSGTAVAPVIYMNASSQPVYQLNGVDQIVSASALTTNTWYHFALTRAGSNSRLFVNGAQVGSTYVASDNLVNNFSNGPMIGWSFTHPPAGFDGWLDEIRISQGFAAWTANFTPPTIPYNLQTLMAQACV